MFEKEIENIKNKYENSLNLINKLMEIYAPYSYGGEKRESIFYLRTDIRENAESIKAYAFNAVNNIIETNRLQSINGNFGRYNDSRTLEDAYTTLKNINIDDFFNSAFLYEEYTKIRTNGKETKIDNKKMIIEKVDMYKDDMILLLNCAWLLNNPAPIDWELKTKIYNKIKDAEPFIFCGCKVTPFKNGKINIQFSDKNLFVKFEEKAKKALVNASQYYKKRQSA